MNLCEAIIYDKKNCFNLYAETEAIAIEWVCDRARKRVCKRQREREGIEFVRCALQSGRSNGDVWCVRTFWVLINIAIDRRTGHSENLHEKIIIKLIVFPFWCFTFNAVRNDDLTVDNKNHKNDLFSAHRGKQQPQRNQMRSQSAAK